MNDRFAQMPDDARLWVYALDRAIAPDEMESVNDFLAAFVGQWQSHGVPVAGSYEVFEARFLLITGYCTDNISGCSTDASVRVVKDIEKAHGFNAFDRTLVFFRDAGGKVIGVKRGDFQELVNQGHAGPGTVVFDTTVETVGDLREGKFETTFELSWHGRAFIVR